MDRGAISSASSGLGEFACGVSSFSKLCGILELKVGHANIFNFLPNIRNLSNSISRDSGGSSDSNHTRYMDYRCLDPKEMGIIFPSLGDARQ
jgi:hypothetical protein